MSDCCRLFSQTFYGLLFSYLTIGHVTLYVQHKFSVSFLLYIATEKTCQINPIITVNSSINAPISETSQKITFARLACLCLKCSANNKAETVLELFLDAVKRDGEFWPSRVRVDHGVENVCVYNTVVQVRAEDRGSSTAGPSTQPTN